MEMGLMIVFGVIGAFVGFKALIYLNKGEEYIDAKIGEATRSARLDARERLQKRMDKMRQKYGKTGLIAYEDLDEAAESSFKVSE